MKLNITKAAIDYHSKGYTNHQMSKFWQAVRKESTRQIKSRAVREQEIKVAKEIKPTSPNFENTVESFLCRD